MCKLFSDRKKERILIEKNVLFNRTTQPSYRTNLFVCHHCKQPGHIKNHCPSLLVGSPSGMGSADMKISYNQRRSFFSSSPFYISHDFITHNKDIISHCDMNSYPLLYNNKNLPFQSFISHFYLQQSSNFNSNSGNASNSSSSVGDGTQSTNTGPVRSSMPHSSHIVTRHAPYQMSYHHRGGRSHRGAGHPRGEPLPKKTTGIPRDRLIPVPKHIPGALRDQTGASVVPRQMA
jgi:hypothetical protein